jgi:hypothetical protein
LKKFKFKVPDNKKIRVIIDTDAYAEGDDQYAIVHALLTPKFDVVGIIAEQFGDRYENTMEKSYEEIHRVLHKMERMDIPVYRGETKPLTNGKNHGESEGARFIVEEALRDDERPLFVLNMGAVTNLATAYLINKEIAKKDIIAIWIGGGGYDEVMLDFNAGNDLVAANLLIGSDIELWQIPSSAYFQMEVSLHELYDRVMPCGNIGRYLYENLLEVNEKECAINLDDIPVFSGMSIGEKTVFIRSGEGWSLGDSPAIGVLITPQIKHKEKRRAQYINDNGSYGDYVSEDRYIHVYHSINSRVILEDFFAKLKIYYPPARE